MEFKATVELFFSIVPLRAVAYHPSMAPAMAPGIRRKPGWIYKPSWDLPLLIFSAILVPLPFVIAWGAQRWGVVRPQQAVDLINIAVAALVGGPHLFSTVTFT